jgi:heme A synthase
MSKRDAGALRSVLAPLLWLNSRREFAAGGLMAALGLFIALKGAGYRAGTLMHMGPGFLPTALGVLLVILGIAIAVPGLKKSSAPPSAAIPALPGEHGENQNIVPDSPQWFAWGCIVASPVAFIFFGRYFGMAPGTFACVFIAALGDKAATWRGTFILATVVTVFGVGLFSYFLQVPMPIFTWRGGL